MGKAAEPPSTAPTSAPKPKMTPAEKERLRKERADRKAWKDCHKDYNNARAAIALLIKNTQDPDAVAAHIMTLEAWRKQSINQDTDRALDWLRRFAEAWHRRGAQTHE